MAAIIRVLAAHFVPLTDTIILEAYEWAVEHLENVSVLQRDETEADTLVAAVTSAN